MARLALFLLMQSISPGASIRTHIESIITRRGVQPKAACENDVPGYEKNCKASCKARTMSASIAAGDGVLGVKEACAKACSGAAKCECFEVSASGKLCRLGRTAGRSTKAGAGNAYIIEEDSMPSMLPEEVDAAAHLPPTCRQGQKVRMTGSCSDYFTCTADASWLSVTCPEGLAYNSKKKACDWPTVVAGCESVAKYELPEVGCGNQAYVLAASKEKVVQDWIKAETDVWWDAVRSNPKIRERPEGFAATNILHTVSIELTAKDDESVVSHYASFTKEEDGTLMMQALALVEQTGTRVNVMAIVSRRSLLNDKASRSGGGKALLRGILETVRHEHPGEGVTLVGTPGDKFVEALYRSHGMEQYGVENTGMPKLKMDIRDECVPYMTDKVLCKNIGVADYAAIGWRMLPGSSYVRETCAHLMPRELYLKEMRKTFGFRS